MKQEEGISLAKMAIVCLLVILVIGAVMMLFYSMSRFTDKSLQKSRDAVATSVTDRLYDLQNQSVTADNDTSKGPEDHPLVTNVVNALYEYNDTDMLYVYTTVRKSDGTYKDSYLYTYKNDAVGDVVITDTSVLPGNANMQQINSTYAPIRTASKQLLKYSEYRCHFTITPVNYQGVEYLGTIIEILEV